MTTSADDEDDILGADITKPEAPDAVDHRPLAFGVYKGCTPSQIAETDPGYVDWLWREVKRDGHKVVSEVLARDCAKDPRAAQHVDYQTKLAKANKIRTGQTSREVFPPRANEKFSKPLFGARPRSQMFDDLADEDDIPF